MQLLLRPKYLQSGIKHVLIALLLPALFSHVAVAAEIKEPAEPLTLEAALSHALRANPEIAVVMREQEAIEGVKTQAAIRPNPTISTSIQDTRSANRQTFLQLNQEIELGNKRQARMEAADAFYHQADAALASKRSEIHANVTAAFYEVLIAQERLSLANTSLEVANLALDAASKRVKAGKSAPVEETKSKIAAVGTAIELNQAKSQLENSRKRLSSMWGNALPVFEKAQGDVTLIPETVDLTTLLSLLEHSPAIKLAKFEIDTRSALTSVERSKATPNITISAGVVNNQELGGLNQALLGLSIPIPVFDRNQGHLQEAVSRQFKAEDALVALKNQLEANLSVQYQRLMTARQSVEAFRTEMLPSAQSAFEAANKGFTAGKFNFLDVLDAQRTMGQAKSQYIQALLEAHLAVAEIERIVGHAALSPTTKP
jgi:cobalt-zinc-cadmium efflux system outer membrane protein